LLTYPARRSGAPGASREKEGRNEGDQGTGDIPRSFTAYAAAFNSLDAICEWAASLGYEGFSFPSWDGRLIHLNKASEFQDYAYEVKGKAA